MMGAMPQQGTPKTAEPAGKGFAIHIPPEEAVALAFFALEVAAGAVSRQRNALSLRMLGVRRDLEFAIAHEGGFRMLVRNSKYLSRFSRP
jgi:hypothetical protein